MPRLTFRSATPALTTLGVVAGMVATAAFALPAAAQSSASDTAAASSTTTTISAPMRTIDAKATETLAIARAAVSDARDVTVDIRSSGLKIAADATVVDTSGLNDVIDKLESVDVTPALLVPELTDDAQREIAAVREGTAALRGQLDAAVAKKAAEEAAAKKKAEEEAAAKAAADAAAAAAAAEAQAEAEAAAAAAEAPVAAAAPAVSVNVDPASAQGIARSMMAANYGWGDDQFACLVSLWNKESGWNAAAYNAGSGAYGIPQALPGNKMASAGADWQTNPATQIAWGLGYISGRYGSACGAWGHSQSTGWY